jgi:hypothetical protein
VIARANRAYPTDVDFKPECSIACAKPLKQKQRESKGGDGSDERDPLVVFFAAARDIAVGDQAERAGYRQEDQNR